MSKRPLTDKQLKFIEEYLETSDRINSVIAAGYEVNGNDNASKIAYQLLGHTRIKEIIDTRRQEIADDLKKQFVNDALVARKVLSDIMNDKEASDRDRITASKDFLDRGGFKAVDEIKSNVEITLPTIKISK